MSYSFFCVSYPCFTLLTDSFSSRWFHCEFLFSMARVFLVTMFMAVLCCDGICAVKEVLVFNFCLCFTLRCRCRVYYYMFTWSWFASLVLLAFWVPFIFCECVGLLIAFSCYSRELVNLPYCFWCFIGLFVELHGCCDCVWRFFDNCVVTKMIPSMYFLMSIVLVPYRAFWLFGSRTVDTFTCFCVPLVIRCVPVVTMFCSEIAQNHDLEDGHCFSEQFYWTK